VFSRPVVIAFRSRGHEDRAVPFGCMHDLSERLGASKAPQEGERHREKDGFRGATTCEQWAALNFRAAHMETNSHPHLEGASVTQSFGSLVPVRLALDDEVRYQSVAALNRLLAHTMAIRDLYKKAHWQTSGANFYELHLLFDKHHAEQERVMDMLAERIQTLGGVARALAREVLEETRLARAPSGVETPQRQLQRLADAHEFILTEARPLAREAESSGDPGTQDMIIGEVVRGNELQCWFVMRHLAAVVEG
jgi:starvation-inducible DNA-binding protein